MPRQTESDKPYWVLDWDSTACSVETLDFLAEFTLGEEELRRFQEITDEGMDGDLTFTESIKRRLSMLKVHKSQVQEAGQELVAYLDKSLLSRKDDISKNKERILVVSGGFEELIYPSVGYLGLDPDNVFANKFNYDDDGYVIGIDTSRPTSKDDGKAIQVAELSLTGPVINIGDGFNDYRIRALGHADKFVAYTAHQPRPRIIPLADETADSFEVETLLY
jgi:D-3-phosphoglycerate dehydrogenase